MITRSTLSALAVFAALGFAASAHAGPAGSYFADVDIVSVAVPTDGLNLNTQKGAEVALQRIHNAADEVCGVKPDIKNLGASADYQACTKVAVDRTVALSGNAILASLNGTETSSQFAAHSR